MIESELQQFVGQSFEFSDGAKITIVQLKPRDTGWAVTYETCWPQSIPRRLVMTESDFIKHFSHLFT